MTADLEAVRRVYGATAERYDERWRRYLEVTVRRTVQAIPDPLEGPLLDVGCGSGLLMERLLSRAARPPITGVDVSLEMLGLARDRIGDRARLVLADGAALPFPRGSFEVVATSSSLHHWPDPHAGLREIARVLRPGGTLVLTDWRADHFPTRVRDLALRMTDSSHRGVLSVDGARAALRTAGFGVTRVERYSAGWSWGLMTITARLDA